MATPQTNTPTSITIMQTTPGWRLVITVITYAGIAAICYALKGMHMLSFASTVLSCTIVFTVGFWARRASMSKLKGRFGPFAPIARGIVEAADGINDWVRRRTLQAGLLVSTIMGIGIAALRWGVEAALGSLENIWLAVGAGLLIGAAAAGPELFKSLAKAASIKEVAEDDESDDDLEPAEAGK